MRYLLTLAILGASLAGCGGSSASPKPTPTPTVNSVAHVETIPPSTPPPIKKRHGAPAANRHGTIKALPTLPPVTFATPTPFPPSAYTAVIHGTVTDAKTRTPLAGAIVTVGNNDRVTRTGPFGHFRIAFPAGPAVAVQVKMNGYAGQLAMGSLKPHHSIALNFKLTSIVPGHPAAPPAPQVFGGTP